MKCKRCKKIVSGDCMLTNGVCVFCWYGTKTWDSNGQLVTQKEATNWIYRNGERWYRVVDGKAIRMSKALVERIMRRSQYGN